MSAHGQSTFHRFVEPRREDTPFADLWLNDDNIWSEDDLADLIRRTPINTKGTADGYRYRQDS